MEGMKGVELIGRSCDNHVVAVGLPRVTGGIAEEVDWPLVEASFVVSMLTNAPNVVLATGNFSPGPSLLLPLVFACS
jgi:hypothetical protein